MRMNAAPAGSSRFGRTAQALLVVALSVIFVVYTPSPAAAQNPYNSLTLTWIAPGDDGNSGQVSSYQLHYSTSAISGTDTTGWWNSTPSPQRITLGPPLASSGSPDSYVVSGLTQGTTYYFVLRALDEVANISGFSNVAVGTTQTCNPPTSMPGNFSAAADTGQVLLSWNSTSDPLAVSLNLYRWQGSTPSSTPYRTLSASSTSYLDTGVSAGTTYHYRAAWMGSACEGPSTSVATATTPGTPAPPPPPSSGDAGSSIRAYPNPASGSIRLVIDVTSGYPKAVLVRLYDMNGHWIATIADGNYSPGANEVTWNRIGRDGQRVAPGYYELLGTVGTAKVRERLVLLP